MSGAGRPHTFILFLLRNRGPQTPPDTVLFHNLIYYFIYVLAYLGDGLLQSTCVQDAGSTLRLGEIGPFLGEARIEAGFAESGIGRSRRRRVSGTGFDTETL